MSKGEPLLNEIRHNSRSIEKARARLRQLVGQDLVDVWRAANMPIFNFGDTKPELVKLGRYRGQTRDRHHFSLHVQCGWRFSRNGSLLFGAYDYLQKPNEEPRVPDDTLLDVRLNAFRSSREMPLKVRSVAVDSFLGFRISFSRGYRLEVLPMGSGRSEHREYWRLLTRGRKHHLVASGSGVTT